MKKIFLLMVLFCSLTLGQGWNNIVQTTLSEPNLDKMDLFTNKDGNHLLIKRFNGDIRYYRVNSSGTVHVSTTLATGGDFPNIVGSNDKLYALYKSGNAIKVRYSTNAGVNWYSYTDRGINPYTINGVDAVYQDQVGIHLVYATQDNGNDYETHYWLLNTSNSWVNYKNVTDYNASEVGGFPTVSFSESRVHVAYNTGQGSNPSTVGGELKTRDKLNSSWQAPQSAYNFGNLTKTYPYGNNLYDFFTQVYEQGGNLYVGLHVKSRSLSGTYWPGSDTYLDGSIFSGTDIASCNNPKWYFAYCLP